MYASSLGSLTTKIENLSDLEVPGLHGLAKPPAPVFPLL